MQTTLTKDQRLNLMNDVRKGASPKDLKVKYGVTGGTVSYYQMKVNKEAGINGSKRHRISPIVLGSTVGKRLDDADTCIQAIDSLWARLPLAAKLEILGVRQ